MDNAVRGWCHAAQHRRIRRAGNTMPDAARIKGAVMSETSSPLGKRLVVPGAGIDLSVSVSGDGPLVILMHGWPEQSLSWRHQVKALNAAGYRTAVPDMRGYGESGKPDDPAAYSLNVIADDMQAVATSLGAAKWVAVGHDWGAPAAWRCALRFPENVAAVFGMSVPHAGAPSVDFMQVVEAIYPDRFFYIRYFQEVGVAEAELSGVDLPKALKQIYWGASGEGVRRHTRRHVPRDATLMQSGEPAPEGPLSFMSDAELEQYAASFRAGGWRGPLNWYRNFPQNRADAQALGDNIIRQPSGFLAGEYEVVLANQLENMRAHLADLRMEVRPAGAGHWIQQERPEETNAALIEFLGGVTTLR
jgi:pimeloyl-ACP methyl ester carboxylesterase